MDETKTVTAKFREAYNLSYTDIYDFASKKQSLKKWEIELDIHHKKMSRKKFKKWLMHFPWIDRNEAEAYCCLIGITKGRISYGATYHDIAFLIKFERPGIVLFNSFARQLKETDAFDGGEICRLENFMLAK